MSEHREYWWVHYKSEIQPAEVDFVGGIPVHFRFLGLEGSIQAPSAELIERLPAPPKPIFQPRPAQPAPAKPQKSGSLLWFVGIILLILVAQFSGALFDMLK